MPYSKWADVNSAIKGIKPQVALAQANLISKWADAMEGSDNPPDSPWAAAIAQFRKLFHAVEGDKWVKKADAEEAEPGGPERCTCPDCDYSVDKERGVPCRSVECPECGATLVADVGEVAVVDQFRRLLSGVFTEFQGSIGDFSSHVRGKFYARFTQQDMAFEAGEWVQDVLVDDPTFGNAVIVDSKGTLYVVTYEEKDDDVTFADRSEWQEVIVTYKPVTEAEDDAREGEGLAERASGHIIGLVESEDGTGPLYVDLVPIRPGWGNTHDNHYYTVGAVIGAAEIWQGAKMYATDHRQEEKSVLTEVSEVVESPASYTADGIPIVRAAIINPLFADIIRLRQDAGILDSLDCSIVARGLVEKDTFEDPATGRTGHRVTEILADDAGIDWVTRAGAGGRALAIAETAEEDNVPEEDEREDVAETEERDLHEGDEDEAQDTVETEMETETVQPDPDPEPLPDARVQEILAETDLSEQAQKVLARSGYNDEDALDDAVKGMRELVKVASRSGQPFGAGGEETPLAFSEKEQAVARHRSFNEIMRRHGRPELPLPTELRD